MSASVLPDVVGRFKIEEALGQGSQGVVLRGVDPDLHRNVAIKLLRPSALHVDADSLMAEARIVSQLQHPNLVMLYEVGNHHGLPYLVSEYVAGRPLRELIDAKQGLPLADCVALMKQMLSGIAYAHEQGAGHYDLNPGNVLVVNDTTAKIMDFGLACESAHQDGVVRGTLRYMSPQRLQGHKPQAACDVFALGVMFAEMLSGKPCFDGPSADHIIARILDHDAAQVVAQLPDMPQAIAAVIESAIQYSAAHRYPHAGAMWQALERYTSEAQPAVDPEAAHASVQFLLRKMTYQTGFAALSNNLDEVRRATDSESNASANQLSNIIAKDVSLMQRVLATANSAAYGGREVNSISRAVVLLGLQQVRMCVTGALLESHFAEGTLALKNALTESFFAGLLATDLARGSGACNGENAFVAGNFHGIGKVLTIHYLPDEYQAITKHRTATGCDEMVASREILGVPYHVMAVEVAKTWQLPAAIVETMRPLPDGPVSPPTDDATQLWCHAAFANAWVSALLDAAPAEAEQRLLALSEQVSGALDANAERLCAAAVKLLPLADKYARLMAIPAGECRLLEQVAGWVESNTTAVAESAVG